MLEHEGTAGPDRGGSGDQPPTRASTSETLSAALRLAPGPELITQLAAANIDELDDEAAVLLMRAWERQARWVAAHSQRILFRVAGPRPATFDEDWAREEVAAALGIAPSTAMHRLEIARQLAGPLEETAASLERGEISAMHAVALVEETAGVADAVATEVQARVLPKAAAWTVSQLRRAVRRAIAVVDPLSVELDHAEATQERDVQTFPDDRGMATLWARMQAPAAELVFTALDACAARKGADGARRAGARRADVLVEWAVRALDDPDLPTRHRRRPQISVTIDLPTLLGLADEPGHLAGYGPIPASASRALAADGKWRRLVTDPVTGALLDYGRRTYTPPADLTDFLLARDGTCRFPRCPIRAERCDLDHRVPWDQGGTTDRDNVGPLCRRHHRLKTHGRWKLRRSRDGTVTWTTRHGATYHVPPPRVPPDG